MEFTASMAEFINEQLRHAGINTSSIVGEIIVSVIVFSLSIGIGWIVYNIFERYFTRWAEETKTKLDDEILRNVKKPIYFFVLIIGAYYGLDFLTILKPYSTELSLIFAIIEILLVTFIITRVVNVLIAWYSERRAKKKMSEHILFVLKKIINVTIYLFAFLVILSVFQIDLSGIVVGLGVGGIAIALALQNILSDAFSAFSIYFDKPFEIGDFIIVGEYAGTVKKIGMKSTRVQLLQGEELVLSNRELTTANVRNFKKMKKRRVVFHFGVTYDTPLKKLKKIPDIIKKIIDDIELTNIDRVHFKEFGDFSLNFEVVYYMKKGDYALYMDTQQEINFKIKEAFEKEGIEMAFPTQTIFLSKTNA
ncbi:MAG: mechanosensitive ion channel family protein [Candidatus Asgardarchaeum californiense]|nr:MAG: mechanosensitive ion channel family protein [Candidatus Asgardarchaeum californiense]